jgi:hypothetical protein
MQLRVAPSFALGIKRAQSWLHLLLWCTLALAAMGRKNRSLLWPVMHLQDALRTATFGQKAWEAMLSAQAASIRL